MQAWQFVAVIIIFLLESQWIIMFVVGAGITAVLLGYALFSSYRESKQLNERLGVGKSCGLK
jgi:hypothetical protein